MSPASMRSWAMLTDSIGGVRSFGPIVETLRTGEPGLDIAYGAAAAVREFDWSVVARDVVAPASSSSPRIPRMSATSRPPCPKRTAAFTPGVAAGYDFSAARTVADVGGGTGTLLAAVLQAHGHLKGVLFYRLEVAAEAAGVLAAAGVTSRCEVVAGDFFAGVPEGADIYLLANVLHDWDHARSVQILASCRQAMAAGGRCSSSSGSSPLTRPMPFRCC